MQPHVEFHLPTRDHHGLSSGQSWSQNTLPPARAPPAEPLPRRRRLNHHQPLALPTRLGRSLAHRRRQSRRNAGGAVPLRPELFNAQQQSLMIFSILGLHRRPRSRLDGLQTSGLAQDRKLSLSQAGSCRFSPLRRRRNRRQPAPRRRHLPPTPPPRRSPENRARSAAAARGTARRIVMSSSAASEAKAHSAPSAATTDAFFSCPSGSWGSSDPTDGREPGELCPSGLV